MVKRMPSEACITPSPKRPHPPPCALATKIVSHSSGSILFVSTRFTMKRFLMLSMIIAAPAFAADRLAGAGCGGAGCHSVRGNSVLQHNTLNGAGCVGG